MQIELQNGKVEISTDFDNYNKPTDLTILEAVAVDYIKEEFEKSGIDFSKAVRFRRRSENYLTLIAPNDVDFCRIKAGSIAIWFSVDAWRLDEDKKSDPRFSGVKNRNTRHWKVYLNRIYDFETNSDLIVDTYKALNISNDEFEKIIPEKYQIDDEGIVSEEACTAPKSAPIKSKRKKGNSIIDNIKDYTVIDLETTSKYTNSAEIIEMSAVRVRSGEIVDKYSTLIKPSGNISSAITAITGITNEMLENAPKIEDKIQEYLDFIGDDIILGHNIVSFDSTILYDLCEKLNLKVFNNDILDTLRYSKYCDIDISDNKLKTISEFFGIEHNAHRALNDCIANFEVYEKLKEHFTGNIILTVSGESRRERTSIENLTVKPCYSNLNGKNIVLTGEFACGQRKDVKSYFEKLGASVKSGLSSKTDYLIIGAFGSPDWKFGDYGDKVAKAQELQLKGKPVEIIQEEEFFE